MFIDKKTEHWFFSPHRLLNSLWFLTWIFLAGWPLSSHLPPSRLKPHDNSLLFLRSFSVVPLLTASPPDRLEATELTWIYPLSLCPTLRPLQADGLTDTPAYRQRCQQPINGTIRHCIHTILPHPPPPPPRHVWHGRPQPHVALRDTAAFPEHLSHPVLPLPEGGEPGMGGREGAAAAQGFAQPPANQTHPHLLSVSMIILSYITVWWKEKIF